MKNNFKLLPILLVSVFGLAGGVSFLNNQNIFVTNASSPNYQLQLTANKNVLETGTELASGLSSTTTETGLGAVTFAYQNVKKVVDAWAHIIDGEIHNVTAINDLLTLDITLTSGEVDVYFGTKVSSTNSSKDALLDSVMYTSSQTITATSSLTVPAGTSHFKLSSSDAVIASVITTYSCSSTVESDENTTFFKGDGSVNNPYQIGTETEWYQLTALSADRSFSGVNFIITADIGPVTEKIGSYSTGFAGVLDGDGHTITFDFDYDANTSNQGLVGHLLSGGVIKNLILDGTIDSTRNNADINIGSFAGVLSGGTIQDCVSNVAITTQGYCFGGIVGRSDNSNGIIDNCTFGGSLISNATTVTNHTIGGIIGFSDADGLKITNCTNTGSIQTKGVQIGGIVGRGDSVIITNCNNSGSITTTSTNTNTAYTGVGGIAGLAATASVLTNCVNTGKITGESCSMVAGIAGKFDGSSKLIDCKNYGDITGLTQVGGLVGRNYGISTSESTYTLLDGCVNEGTIAAISTGNTTTVGGMAGYTSYGKFVDCVNGNATDTTKGTVKSPNLAGYATENHGTGGIVGFNENPSVFTNCTNYGAISSKGSEVGGIGGKTGSATFTGCTNYGAITGYIYVAGISGRAVKLANQNACTFANNTNHGDITATSSSVKSTQLGQIHGDLSLTIIDNGGNFGDGTLNPTF